MYRLVHSLFFIAILNLLIIFYNKSKQYNMHNAVQWRYQFESELQYLLCISPTIYIS